MGNRCARFLNLSNLPGETMSPVVVHSPITTITPIPFHLPELVFKLGLTNAVDILNNDY